mgnify:CR=1 FL=1
MARKKSRSDDDGLFGNTSHQSPQDEGRQKALDATLADITKRHGEGTILRLGDAQHLAVETIPTGSLTVDIALGVGGVPRGRITEIYGPESSGKCLSKDTFCLTEAGLLTIEEVFSHNGHKATCTNRILEQEFSLVNEQGILESTSHFTWNNRKPIKRIRTSAGLTIEATHNHRLRVMNDDGHIVWRNAGDIRLGDYLPMLRGTNQFGSSELSTDEATFIGYLVADGSLSDKVRIAFSNSDPQVITEYHRIAATLTDTAVRVYPKTNTATIDHHINDKAFRTLVKERYGLEYELAAGKTVPQCVRMASREAQIAFLRAYFELECSVEAEKSTIEVSSASRKLLEQIQLMLLNLGLVSLLREKIVNDTTYYRLFLSGPEYVRYGEMIGFATDARLENYNSRPLRTQIQTNVDSIPYQNRLLRSLYDGTDTDREGNKLFYDYMGDTPKARLTYDRLQQIIAYMDKSERSMGHSQWLLLEVLKDLRDKNFFFDPVESIEDDEMPTFDVVMPETHSFWSNGMISHNTTMCLSIIAQSQKRGGICAFVDMEHALDPNYAERIGVNLDTLYVSQPDTGEQALEITESLVRSGALDVVVIDSVAALVPRAEIEGEMGDSHVGLQARLMSQALRKLSGTIKQTNTTVLFTNQLREKIGVMFGCFHGDAPVLLADGTTEKISTLVEAKRDVEVMSYNEQTNTFEPRRIVNWFDNGLTDEFLEFTVAGGHTFTCTANHRLLTEDGYVSAGELTINDKLLTALPVLQSALMHELAGSTYAMPEPTPLYSPTAMPILDIMPVTDLADMRRFDIEVEGNHCYVVDGVVVHNSPETTSGGRALKFYASVRLDIRRIQAIKQGGDNIGNRTRVRVTKNKVSAPFKEAEFDIMFFERGGVSKPGEIVDLGTDLGIIDKRGAFFRYNEGLLGQGRENSKVYLQENPAVADEIEDLIRAHFGLPTMLSLAGGVPAAARPAIAPTRASPPKRGKVSEEDEGGTGAGNEDAPPGEF